MSWIYHLVNRANILTSMKDGDKEYKSMLMRNINKVY